MGTRASDLLAAALRDHVAALSDAEADLLAGGPEAVHDSRVAVRRLRADLGEFPRLVDRDAVADLRERLQEWGHLLGEARDLEVVLGMLDEAPLPETVRERARASWSPRAVAARTAVVEHLGSAEHARLTADLVAAAAHPPLASKAERPWEDELPRGLRRAQRRVERRDERLADLEAARDASGIPGAGTGEADAGADAHAQHGPSLDTLDEAAHALRKAVRRARYAAEVLARGTGHHAAHAVDAVAELAERQDELGATHDRTLLRQALVRLTAQGT